MEDRKLDSSHSSGSNSDKSKEIAVQPSTENTVGEPALETVPLRAQTTQLSDATSRPLSPRASTRLAQSRTFLGLHPIVPITEEDDTADHSQLWWPRMRLALREPIAEFMGVFIMLFFGNGSVAQVLLSTGQASAPGGDGFGAYNAISWGWGIGVMLGVYVAGDSGAYLKCVFVSPSATFLQKLTLTSVQPSRSPAACSANSPGVDFPST